MAPPRKTPATNGKDTVRRQNASKQLMETKEVGIDGEAPRQEPSILREAHEAVNGERMENYGEQRRNFTDIGDMWSVVLRDKLVAPITPQDVAMCQIAVKLSRLTRTGGQHRDSIVDIAGYAECLDKVNMGLNPFQE
jgi:hypothetical protein